VTVRIDSKVAEDIDSGSGGDEARRLRFVLETVGKTAWPGGLVPKEYAELVAKHNAKAEEDDNGLPFIDPAIPPGRDIRCIISVAMLSEGWDATTVTHVIGMRPFGSQLLCEQVVGRALRRTRYDLDEQGPLIGETAEVLGVPFQLIPLKTHASRTGPVKSKETHHVFAVDGKEEFEITFPVVEGYDDPGYAGVKIEWKKVPTLELDPLKVPDSVLVRPLVSHDGGLLPFGPGKSENFDLSEWRAGVRDQQVAFLIAEVATKRVLDEHGGAVPAHRLFPQLLGYARWLLENQVKPMGHRQRVDVALNPYFDRAVEALCGALVTVSRDRADTERARIPKGQAGLRSTAGVEFHTTRKVWSEVSRCHLNSCAMDTQQWEQSAAYYLDTHPKVQAWVKNDHLGLFIRYRLAGRPHNYVPDFIVRFANGRMLIIEVKGELGDAEIKQAAAWRWVAAVNREKSYGEWSYHLVRHPADVAALLDELGG
jgi:type III restriction enzyme